MSDFPHCKRAGMTMAESPNHIESPDYFVPASQIEAYLAKQAILPSSTQPKEQAMAEEFFKPEDFALIVEKEQQNPFFNYDKISKSASAIANRLLKERGVAICAHRGPSNPEGVWIAKPYQDADSTHTALLVSIQPIQREEPDSPTELLQLFINCANSGVLLSDSIVKRARKLAEKK